MARSSHRVAIEVLVEEKSRANIVSNLGVFFHSAEKTNMSNVNDSSSSLQGQGTEVQVWQTRATVTV